MAKLDWEKANAIEKGREPGPQRKPPKPYIRKNKTPFAIVYARYANAERRAGRKPMPPVQWIDYLKTRARPL